VGGNLPVSPYAGALNGRSQVSLSCRRRHGRIRAPNPFRRGRIVLAAFHKKVAAAGSDACGGRAQPGRQVGSPESSGLLEPGQGDPLGGRQAAAGS